MHPAPRSRRFCDTLRGLVQSGPDSVRRKGARFLQTAAGMTIVPDDHIDGIFNYCVRRCELCSFTARCTLYQSEREYERTHPDATWQQHVHDSFAETFRLLEDWCKREGIDFEEIRRAAESDKMDEAKRLDESVDGDPLQKMATTYTHAALNVIDAMAPARAIRRWPSFVEEALDTISWHAGMVSAKVSRALHGQAERGAFSGEHPVQNDWNGSAKLARILVDESKRAWEVVMREGEAPQDSPLIELITLLGRVDEGLAERFPDAMQFVRPGFDEAGT
jgi:hypothetical protein